MKPKKKADKRLNRRISAWAQTLRSLRPDQHAAFRKPGSMKRK